MFVARGFDPTSGQVLRVPVSLDDGGLPHGAGCSCAQCQAQLVQAVPKRVSCPSDQCSSLDPSSSAFAVSSSEFAMAIALFPGAVPELVYTPFLEVHHPSFVEGYYHGAEAYFEEVWDEERDCKGRELSDRVLIEELGAIVFEYARSVSWEERGDWLAWMAGFLAGFISARIPSAFPLYGNCASCHQPVLACGHCPRCFSKVQPGEGGQ